jgi:hypothetical protein
MDRAADFAFALGATLAVWAALLALCSGLGEAILRLGYGSAPMRLPLAGRCLLGYAVALVVLQVWHLFRPVDGWAFLFLAALAAASLAPRARAREPRCHEPREWTVVLPLAVATFWLADRALGPCLAYDSGNYHLTLVRWLSHYPLVPGLANLNPLYGLNSTSLLFPAVVELGPLEGRSGHFVGGFLLLVLLLQFVPPVAVALRSGRAEGHQAAALVFLYPVVALIHATGGSGVASHSTDLVATALALSGSCLLLQALDTPGSDLAQRPDPRLFASLGLFAVLPCVKSTAAIFAAVAWLGTLALVWRASGSSRKRPLVVGLLFSATAAASWLARGAVLSGYPLFPLSLGGFDVDWRLPERHLEGYRWWTRTYTRAPEVWDRAASETLADWLPHWFRIELRTALHEAIVPLLLLGVLAVAALIQRARRAPAAGTPGGAVLWLSALLALPVWFFSAPSFRYAQSLLWVLCAATAARVLPAALATRQRPRAWLAGALVVMVVAPLALQAYYTARYPGPEGARAALVRAFLTGPGPDRGFHPPPRVELKTVATGFGLTVFMPAAGPEVEGTVQWPAALPWDSPLPATSLLLDGLRARRPGDLAAGFVIDDGGPSWARRAAPRVAEVAARTSWSVARLAVYFCVRPELIEQSIRLAATPTP